MICVADGCKIQGETVMMKQIKNIFIYILVILLLMIASLFYRQSFLVMLIILMFFLPICSILPCHNSFSLLDADFDLPTLETLKGTTLPVKLQLRNNSQFPLIHVEIGFRITSPYYPNEDVFTYVLPALRKDTTSLEIPITLKHYGLFQFEIITLKTYDYLHFVSYVKPVSKTSQLIVHPDNVTTIKIPDVIYEEGFDEYETSLQKGNLSSNVTDVREYQPGDRLQKIHWKLSAKIDKLMVKENEAAASHQFYVLMELYFDEKKPHLLDQSIENAYALSMALLDAKENFFLGYYSVGQGDFISHPILSKEHLLETLSEAYYEKPYQTKDFAYEMYQNSNQQKGTLLHVTGETIDI